MDVKARIGNVGIITGTIYGDPVYKKTVTESFSIFRAMAMIESKTNKNIAGVVRGERTRIVVEDDMSELKGRLFVETIQRGDYIAVIGEIKPERKSGAKNKEYLEVAFFAKMDYGPLESVARAAVLQQIEARKESKKGGKKDGERDKVDKN